MATNEELKGEELDAVLEDLQRRLDRLRILYEQHFLGIEKLPPSQLQRDVVRIIYQLQRANIRGAAAKFRFQSLQQRFNAHKAYWVRTTREIEEGRYHRQTARAERRQRAETAAPDVLSTEDYLAINTIRDSMGEEAAREAEAERRRRRAEERSQEDAEANAFLKSMGVAPVESSGASSGASSAASSGASSGASSATRASDGSASGAEPRTGRDPSAIRGMSAAEVAEKADRLREMRQRMKGASPALRARERSNTRLSGGEYDVDRAVYDRFVGARERLGQSTDKLSFEAVKASLEKQRAKVRQEYNCARVDFDVVVKDGNAFLKPIPVKDE